MNPDVLLLDEPLSNLDAKIRIQVRAEIRKLQRELGITTVYVTHDQEEALTLSDRIAVIDHGKLQQIGSPRDLYAKPRNPFVADFIGINNLLPGAVTEIQKEKEWMSVQTEVGSLICTCEGSFNPKDKCMISVRPETASIHPTEIKQEGLNVLAGTINFASYIGNTIRYDVELSSGKIFKVDIPNPWYHQPFAQGEKVFIGFPQQITLGIPIA